MTECAIVINCMPRSGSNILWNIIGSSPDVAMTREEFHRITNHSNSLPIKLMMRINALYPKLPLMHSYINNAVRESRNRALKFDTQNLQDRSLCPNDMTHICFKVMGRDNHFNDLIANSFPKTKFIYLTRQPEGLCDSYYRRGFSPEEAAKNYAVSVKHMKEHFKRNPEGLFIHFEDLAQNLQKTIDYLFKHLSIRKPANEHYLLKQKAFGPGNEQSSRKHHTKKLMPPMKIQESFKVEKPGYYLSAIPNDYWERFNTIAQQVISSSQIAK